MTTEPSRRELSEEIGAPVEVGVPLSELTSFGIGGPAALLVRVADAPQLSRALAAARRRGLDVSILGGGTNILASDDGFDGLVIAVESRGVSVCPDAGVATVGAGERSAALVERLVAEGWGGLEFAAGLPGTVGGAVAGNAGCFGRTFGEALAWATLVHPDGRVERVEPPWLELGYRTSRLSRCPAFITEVGLGVRRADPAALADGVRHPLQVRAERHPPPGARTAGSYFKNLPPLEPGGRRRAAGALLDAAGAHGMREGDAAVFERHANIIVNRGRATAADVLRLAARMRELVRERFSVELEAEVRFLGPRPAGL